jgi:hypothetical protein
MKSLLHSRTLQLVGAIGLVGVLMAGGGLYVTHRDPAGSSGPPHTGPGLGAVELGYRTRAYSVMLERGSYHVASTLTDCGGWIELLVPQPQAANGPRVAWDDTGGPQGFVPDPHTGLGPHHVTQHSVDVTILERHQYWLSGSGDMTYNNRNCTMVLTFTPK